MKQVNAMPENGQFVVMWVFNNKLWASTFKTEEGILYEYNDEESCFEPSGPYFSGFDFSNVQYFVLEHKE